MIGSKTKIIKIIPKNNNYSSNNNISNSDISDHDISNSDISDNHTSNSNILELILNNTNKIMDKLNSLEERIQNIEKKLESTTKNSDLSFNNLKELKKEDLIVKKEDVLKALSYKDYRSVIYIFKNIYKNKTNTEYAYPIKITGKRSYEYYHNMKWNPDLYGHYSTSIICMNIQNLFMKYNNIDDFSSEDFIMNQEFICKLSDEKHQKSIFKNIIEEVRINNLN